MSSEGNKYRALNFDLLSGGNGAVIAYFPQTRQTTILTPQLASQLVHLRTFREESGHVAQLVSATSGDAAAMEALVRGLIADGVLVKADALCETDAVDPTAPITAVGVPTCGRITMLHAALSSYEGNFARHGRRPDLLVADDARDPSDTRRCRDSLGELSKKLGRTIFHAGLEQKERLARALAARSGVPEPLVRFALFSNEGFETIGANRNALALLSAGRVLFCADDDTSGELYTSPDARPGLSVAGERDPTELWFFPSREAALSGAGNPIEQDLLAAHEELLGRVVRERAASFERRGELALGETCDHLFDGWERGAGRVRVSFAGVLGDSGMYSGLLLRQLRGGSRERMNASESAYAMATTSREVLRVAPSYTVTHGPPYMLTSGGLDYRDLAPPFFPIGRNEDGIFGAMLSLIAPDAVFGHIPFAIVHAAAADRRYYDFVAAAKRPRFADSLIALMSTARLVGRSEEARMIALGRYLQDIARASSEVVVDALCSSLLPMFSYRLEQIDRDLAEHRGSPDYWARDLVALRVGIRQSLATEPYWLPLELSEGRSPEEVLALTRRLLLQFGELLEAWPTLFRTAKELVAGGDGLPDLVAGA